jgi:hypothetical protein
MIEFRPGGVPVGKAKTINKNAKRGIAASLADTREAQAIATQEGLRKPLEFRLSLH